MKKVFYTNKLAKGIIFLFIYTIFLTSISFADTHIAGGNVSGIWETVNSPYIIDGEIDIPVDSTLIIEPGVSIIFSGHYSFYVHGRLLAIGTINDTISFTMNDTTGFSNPDTTAGGWHGLRFIDTEVNSQDSSKIIYCKLEYGKAVEVDRTGGAISCSFSSDILIQNCLIRRNFADSNGGGIYCHYSSPAIYSTTVSSNISSYNGGGIYFSKSYPSLKHISIVNNYSDYHGGGMFCDESDIEMTDILLKGNHANLHGGGIYLYESFANLQDAVISENYAGDDGGGIFCYNSSPSLYRAEICQNIADCGGGIYCSDTSSPLFDNVTISENYANYGGGISCWLDSSPTLNNSIMWNNQVEEFYLVYGSTITITYSDIMGGWTGEGNIDEDPLFEDPSNGDFHLTENSPCIDAGNSASIPDPDGTIVDMGAYYFHQNDVVPPTADFCADVTTGNAPLTVHFTDTSYPGNSDIASWYWNFGDSTFSVEQNPVHTYDSLGIYTVSLRVITENNGIDTETKIDYISAFGSGFHIPGGDVSGVWIANFSPYIIDGDIQIQQGDSLLIESGVEVLFSGHYECNIYGRLLAMGTETDSIIFTAQDTTTGWHGLRFYNTDTNGQDSSIILCCKLEYGKATGGGYDRYGGAVYCENSSPDLNNVTICKNTAYYGGGISCDNSSPQLMGVTLYGNSAHLGGGGIYLIDSYPVFNSDNRCNIFLNYANHGNDIYAFQCTTVNVIVDTFTVFTPDNHFASPINNFTFDILNGKIVPIEQDLYVSPYGSNNNSGLSPDDPLRTISYALVNIASNEQDPHTIHCANGIYSFSETGEVFPVNCRSYVSIHGQDGDNTILDGEEKYGVVFCKYDTVVTMENMTVKNGNSPVGSGIYCYESILDLNNMTITENGTSSDKGYISQDIKNNKNKEILKPANNYSKIDNPFNYTGFMPDNNKLNEVLSLLEDCPDKGRSYMGGGIFCCHSILKITNTTISFNNSEDCYGGGIYYEHSNSILSNVEITGNTGKFGCGIYSSHSSLNLYNTIISANTAYYINGYSLGGGFCSYKSTSSLINTLIDQNSGYCGGGIYSEKDSLLSLSNVTISNNSATFGGGIYCDESSPDLYNVSLSGNYAGNGGALYLHSCSPYLSDVTISENHGKYCGGIACDDGTVFFNDENLCSIFLNYGGKVNDLYFNSNCPITDVVVDTFTVLQPTEYFTYPLDLFTFDINNGKIEPVAHDLYIDPDGSDDNSGLTANDPLKTIAYALVKIHSAESSPRTIHCAEGLYSSSETGEKFPLNCKNFVSMIGEDADATVLDGEDTRALMFCLDDSNVVVTDMTIMNGHNMFGGGIYCSHSTLDVARITFMNNYADALGGGVLCWGSDVSIHDVTFDGNVCQYGKGGGISCDDYSNVSVINGLICNNTSKYGGGLSCSDDSRIVCKNSTIENNTSFSYGGGIYCSDNSCLICIDLTIANNTSASGAGGIDCRFSSTSELTDVIVRGNVGHRGGGIECFNDSYIDMKNVLIHRNRASQRCNGIYCAFASMNLVNVTISKNNSSIVDVGGIYLSQADANVVNCILWNDWHDILLQDTLSNVTVIYSDIEGGWTGEGNIDADPLFINPNENNYQLSSTSPCINTGIPDTTGLHIPITDLNGNPRIYDDIIDMGCYEWQGIDVDPEPIEPNKFTITCFPNPFSTSTSIKFSNTSEITEDTEIKIYNIKGQLIKTISSFPNPSLGMQELVWDGKDESGNDVKSGVYLYKLSSNDEFIGKVVKLK